MFFHICLIAPPDNLRHSLAILLAALTRGEQINAYDTIDVALHEAATLRPGLLIVDGTTAGCDLAAQLQQLQQQWPQAQIVVLVDDEEQIHPKSVYPPTMVVTAGTAAPRLRTLLDKLLQELRKESSLN